MLPGMALRRPRRSPGWTAAIAVLAAATKVAACGSNASISAPANQVQARPVPGLGTIITDGKGFTLYMYAPDHQGL
jgi:predicted lipoprotein with Yx(FWY)xxD motif